MFIAYMFHCRLVLEMLKYHIALDTNNIRISNLKLFSSLKKLIKMADISDGIYCFRRVFFSKHDTCIRHDYKRKNFLPITDFFSCENIIGVMNFVNKESYKN